MQDITPMMRQYQAIKNEHKDSILFFRLGDFYEMFFDDAKVASKELEITLTARPTGPGRKNKIPMCGIPFHSASSYILKLLNRGFKVAICEQVEDPKEAVGLTKREVVKIITPGTVIDSDLLAGKKNIFLASVVFEEKSFGFAYCDISTGEFKVTEIKGEKSIEDVINEIDRIEPEEILFEENLVQHDHPLIKYLREKNIAISTYEAYQIFDAKKILLEHFRVSSLEGFGCEKLKMAQESAAALIVYLRKTQKSGLNQIQNIKTYFPKEFMYLDASTRRNLEILKTLREENYEGSLLWFLDHTKTAMGARLLKQWLLEPLLNEEEINLRLDAVEDFQKNYFLHEKIEKSLSEIGDLERLSVRIITETANARDLISLKNSLQEIPEIFETLKGLKAKLLSPDGLLLDAVSEIIGLIEKNIVEDPPVTIKEGHLIKKGVCRELDELIEATSDTRKWIADLEKEERERTGIKSLKIGYTSVFGYYIEITKNNLDRLPAEYIRKQTLVNAERFITPALKEKEAFLINAEQKRQKLEYELFVNLRKEIAAKIEPVKKLAGFLAVVDVLASFARTARGHRFCRPKILPMGYDKLFKVKNARHPVLERLIKSGDFIPNNIEIGGKDNFFQIITGPNMAGKSTFMRQSALIVLMAQIGCFVPAEEAEIPLVDRIFTRVGAIDDIFGGQSTFMVEMSEVANILNHATSNSLIILDEIGRGTSTYDGMSLAQAVAEYIYKNIKAKTFFATHYHELTVLSQFYPGIKNYTFAVKEVGEEIIFLYRLIPGRASKSYGIHVAKLAGVPREVLQRAREILINFEKQKELKEQKIKITSEEISELDEGEQLKLI